MATAKINPPWRTDPLQVIINVSGAIPACVVATQTNQIYYALKPDKWMEFDLFYKRDVDGDVDETDDTVAKLGVIEDVSVDLKTKMFFLTYTHSFEPQRTDIYTTKVSFAGNNTSPSQPLPADGGWTKSTTLTEEFFFSDSRIRYYVQTGLLVAYGNPNPSTDTNPTGAPWSINDGASWNSGHPSSTLATGLILPAPIFVQTDNSTNPPTKKTYYLQTALVSDPASPLGRAYTCTLCDINGSVLRTLTGPTPNSECHGMTAGNGKLVGLFLTNPDFLTDFGFLNEDDVGAVTGFTDADRNNPLLGSVGGQFQTGTNINDGGGQNWVIGVSSDGTSWTTSTKVSDPAHTSDEINGFTPSPGLEWPEFNSWLDNFRPPILPFNVAPASSFATGVIDFAPGWNLFVFASNQYKMDTYSESVPVAGRTNEGSGTAAPDDDFKGIYGWPQVLTLKYIYPTPLQIYTSPDGKNWTQRFKGTWSNGTTPPVPPSNPLPNKMTAYEMINPSPTPHGGLQNPPMSIGRDGGSTYVVNGLPQGFDTDGSDPSGSNLETLAGALAGFSADVAASYPGPPAGSGSISIGGISGSATITVTLLFDTTQTITYDVVEYSFAFDYLNQKGIPEFDTPVPAGIATAGWAYPIKKTS